MDIAKNIFSPSAIADAAVASVTAAKENPNHLRIGLDQFDDHFVMAKPRKVIGIMADTSHGKTSFMTALARSFTAQLGANEIGVYATWEDSVEDFGLSDIANMSMIPVASLFHGDVKESEFQRMINAAARRAASPLWLIGHSEANVGGRPRLTMTDIYAAVDHLVKVQNKKPRFIMLDYLQRISREDSKSRDARLQFSDIMDKIKDLSLAYNTTPFIGTQVQRAVRDRKYRQPQIHDAMETSNFEHTCDGIISLWIPAKSDNWDMGESLIAKDGIDAPSIVVTPNLICFETLKQKKGKSNVRKYMDFVPEYNMFVRYGTADEERKNAKA
jgi:replicative DNA helicase